MTTVKSDRKFAAVTTGAVALAGLATMGLVYLWSDTAVWDAAFASRRAMLMVMYQCLGIALGLLMSAIIGWRRVVKAAPFLFAGWIALLLAAVWFTEPVAGHYRFIPFFGPVRVDLFSLFIPVAALMVAWLRSRFPLGRCLTILFASLIALSAVLVSEVLSHPSRREAVMRSSAQTKESMKAERAAFVEAKWFSGVKSADEGGCSSVLAHFQHQREGQFVDSARHLGKWYPLVELALFGLLAASLAILGMSIDESAKRAFVSVTGLFLLASPLRAAVNWIVRGFPHTDWTPALCGYNCTLAAGVWMCFAMCSAASRCVGKASPGTLLAGQ